MKVIKYWKSLPKDGKILCHLNTFNHNQSLLKTILLYAYGIAQDARVTCKFYDLHVVEGQIMLNIVSIITVPSDMRDMKNDKAFLSLQNCYTWGWGMQKKKNKIFQFESNSWKRKQSSSCWNYQSFNKEYKDSPLPIIPLQRL